MPIISDLEVTGADYDSGLQQITVSGVAFAESQYDGKIEVSADGSTWVEPDTYDSWGDSEITATFTAALDAGTYQVRVTNGDNELSAVLMSAFVIAGGYHRTPQMAIGIYVGL